MDKVQKHQTQVKAMERTLRSVKSDIAFYSQELKEVMGKIEAAKKDLQTVLSKLQSERSKVTDFIDSTADVFQGKIKDVKDAISQRKEVEKTIKGLEQAKHILEIEIAERKGQKVYLPGAGLVQQVLDEAKRTLEVIENKTQTEAQMKSRLEKENASLLDANNRIKTERKASEDLVKALEVEAKQIEVKRIAHSKKLAEEQAKARAIRMYERDLKVMHKRLTDEYQKAYKNRGRRSTI